jgi:hypothetical protein
MFGPSASLSSGRASARRWPPVGQAVGFSPPWMGQGRVKTRILAGHDRTRKRVPAGLKSGVSVPQRQAEATPIVIVVPGD